MSVDKLPHVLNLTSVQHQAKQHLVEVATVTFKQEFDLFVVINLAICRNVNKLFMDVTYSVSN
jgi:hypothetical protein